MTTDHNHADPAAAVDPADAATSPDAAGVAAGGTSAEHADPGIASPAQESDLPTPPWTAVPETSIAVLADTLGVEHGSGPRDSSEPGGAGAERKVGPAWLRRSVPVRTAGIAAACVLCAVGVFGAGTVVGARDPLLAPVRISPAPASAGLSDAERVFATTQESVVTIEVPSGGTGSGFFYRPDMIVTNDHVVASSPEVISDLALGKRPEVTIVLSDGRTSTAKVVAVDPRLDLAILSTPTNLGVRPLAFADSDDVQPGAPAFVVGSPFGMATSIAAGIVSGVDRGSQFAADPVQNELIQTDAAVNPGNSGGPLLDASAGVLGIVTLRPDEAGGRVTQGLAFAIPSALVVDAIDQLERYGEVSHPQIGVTLEDAKPDQPAPHGAVVLSVVAGSPAAEAGLLEGDEIVRADGAETPTAASVIDTLVGKRAGDDLTLVIRRDGKASELTITLRERPNGS